MCDILLTPFIDIGGRALNLVPCLSVISDSAGPILSHVSIISYLLLLPHTPIDPTSFCIVYRYQPWCSLVFLQFFVPTLFANCDLFSPLLIDNLPPFYCIVQ